MRTYPTASPGAPHIPTSKHGVGPLSCMGTAGALVRCRAEMPRQRRLPAQGLPPALTQQDIAGPGLSVRHQLAGPQAAVT